MEGDEYNFDWNDCLNLNTRSTRRSINREPTVSIDEIEAEKKCEFIQLNDEIGDVKLRTSEGFTSQWERLHGLSMSSAVPVTTVHEASNTIVSTVSNNNVFVISLLGDTGDGKSFLINHLLPLTEKERPVVIDEAKRDGSTTANITCFESTFLLPASSRTNTLLLDYEGENGTYLPRLLKHMSDEWTDERAEKRRKAVSEYFPKLAYTISNVIILLSRDDFSKYEYISRCYDFAERATKNLQQNPYKPVIIMIQNYSSIPMLQSIKETTQQFFEIHLCSETEKLRNFFEAVYCMRLPYKSNETHDIDDINKGFTNQMTDLKNLLTHIQRKHNKERSLPHISWLEITKLVVEIVSKDRTIMMHMLLRQVLVKDPGALEENTVMFLFNILYNKRDIHSTCWFHFCRNFAMSVLARGIAIRFLHHMKYIPDSNLKNMTIREEARVCLEKLWKHLDEFRPCTALYMGKGYSKETDYPIFCLQHKGIHQEHRTSKLVYGVPLITTRLLDIPRLWSVYDVWSGTFESDDPNQGAPSQEIYEKFYQEIYTYMEAINDSPDALHRTLVCLLEQYEINIITSQSVTYSGACCFCFQKQKRNRQAEIRNTNVANRIVSGNSVICYECQEKILLLKDNPVEILLPPA